MMPGDLVWYRPTKNDGGHDRRIPAVYLRVGSARVQVEVLKRDGTRARIWVARKNLESRGPEEGIKW
jgi:hypothetical protein